MNFDLQLAGKRALASDGVVDLAANLSTENGVRAATESVLEHLARRLRKSTGVNP